MGLPEDLWRRFQSVHTRPAAPLGQDKDAVMALRAQLERVLREHDPEVNRQFFFTTRVTLREVQTGADGEAKWYDRLAGMADHLRKTHKQVIRLCFEDLRTDDKGRVVVFVEMLWKAREAIA
jgi:hypothetical protein